MTRQGQYNHTDGGHGSFFCIVSLSVAAVLFVCALLAMRGCGGRGRGDGGQADTTYKYIYVHDTVRKSVTVEKPRPVAEFVPVLDTIVIRDTVEILRDYFAERLYRYDYADTDIRFTSDIVVCENELRTVSTDYELFRESLTIEKTVTRQPVSRQPQEHLGKNSENRAHQLVRSVFIFQKNDNLLNHKQIQWCFCFCYFANTFIFSKFAYQKKQTEY